MSKSAFIKFIVSDSFARYDNSASTRLKRRLNLLSICLVAALLSGLGVYVNSDSSELELNAAKPSARNVSTNQKISDYQPGNSGTSSLTGKRVVNYVEQSGMDKSLYEAVTAARYKVVGKKEILIASNDANNLKAEFDKSGLQLESISKDKKWQSRWQLRSLGYGDNQAPVEQGEITSKGQRVEISRKESNLLEWYENRPNGLEHGFTLSQRPAFSQNADAALRLVMDVGGDLQVRAEPNGQGVILTDNRSNEILRYEKLKVWDAAGREQTARMKVSGDRILLDVEEQNAEYPLTIDPTFVEAAKLLPSDGANFDQFGYTVAISGDTAVVGAYLNDDNGNASGSVYVFVRNGNNWTEQQKLLASDAAADDQFGSSLDIDGDTIVVGAYGDDDNGTSAGSAYVFVRNGALWSELQKLLPGDVEAGDQFAQVIAISGDTIIASCAGDDQNGTVSGSAYVFVRNAGSWSQQQKLFPSDPAAQDLFGDAVDIDGNTVVIGAYGDDDNGSSAGSAYVFVRNAGVWTEQQKLLAADGTASDIFGDEVAISGDTIVVGAYWDADNGAETGSAYVFVRSAGNWSQQQKLLPSDSEVGNRFGQAVAISEDTVVVGAYLNDDNADNSGSAYVFVRSGAVWTEQQKLLTSDAAENDFFGSTVAIDGDTIVIGAFGDDDNEQASGSAYVFGFPPANQAPVAQCRNVQVTLASGTAVTADADINDGSYDPDGDGITLSQAPLSPYPVGSTIVTLTVEDSSGETDSCTGTVTVLYNFAGFFQPVDNLPTLNDAKAGSAIPVKFSLDGNKGLNIFAAGYPSSGLIACSSDDSASTVEETVNAGGSVLTYDAATNTYSYIWKTDKNWKGTCRQLVVKLSDGTIHVANFRFK
jgi:hypothetical protein